MVPIVYANSSISARWTTIKIPIHNTMEPHYQVPAEKPRELSEYYYIQLKEEKNGVIRMNTYKTCTS